MAIQNAKNIWVAAGDGDLARVTELVESHGLNANIPDEFTYTPMHAAASYGHLQVLEYLIGRGGDVNITDDEGDTPLYTVENIETARFLVEHGAEVGRRNHEGISPIEHLREDFPQVAAYLESLLPGGTPARGADGGPGSLSQHSQNAASEDLTEGLMARIRGLAEAQGGAEMDEEAVRRIVTESVMASLARGQSLGQEAEEGTWSGGEKRTRHS